MSLQVLLCVFFFPGLLLTRCIFFLPLFFLCYYRTATPCQHLTVIICQKNKKKDRWCSREHQVTIALVRGTADARDPDVQKKTLAGNGIVMALAGSSARVGRPVELTQVQHTEGIIDDRTVIQHQTPAIRTVQETVKALQR